MRSDTADELPAPALPGPERDPALVAPAESYPVGALVWVFHAGGWRPGTVLGASPRGVLARFQAIGAGGAATDTVTGIYIAIRGAEDQR